MYVYKDLMIIPLSR